MGINHIDHLAVPQAQGEQKVMGHLLHHCKPVLLVESYEYLGILHDEGQTPTVGLNMQCTAHTWPSLCPNMRSTDTEDTTLCPGKQ